VDVRVDVLDSAGNAARASFTAVIDKDGKVTQVSPKENASFGCACGAAGGAPGSGLGAGALLIGAALLARRGGRRAQKRR
jgi:MYXO-CTERM domain-containing protein